MDFRDILVILKRRKWIFLAIVGVLLAGYGWTVQAERQFFTASAHLLVSKSSVRALVGDRIQVFSTAGTAAPTQMTLLTSPVIYEKAAKLLAERKEGPDDPDALRGIVSVRGDEGALAIYVTGTGESRHTVLRAVGAVAEAVQEHSKDLARREYVEADKTLIVETEANRDAIQEAQEMLDRLRREFHQKTGFEIGFGGFERESARIMGGIDALEQKIKEVQARRAVLESKIDLFGRAPDGTLDLSQVTLAIDLAPSLDDLRRRIVEARSNLSRLDQVFTENHPDVVRAHSELAGLSEQMKGALVEKKRDLDAEEAITRKLCGEAQKAMEALSAFRAEFMRQQRGLEILLETQSWLARTLAELRLGKSFQSGSVHAVSLPQAALPIDSRIRQAWPIMVVLALMTGAVIAYMSEYLDDTIQSEYQVSRYLDLGVVGYFPYMDEEEKRFIGGLTPSHPLVEIFNRMTARLLSLAREARGAKVILISSPCPDDGKTTVAANLAVSFALMGQKTVLIDADLRKPRMHQFFEMKNDVGLSSYLTGRLEARQVLEGLVREEVVSSDAAATRIRETALRDTPIPGLKIVTAGPVTTNPMQCLESARFTEFLEGLKRSYDRIVIDSPPLQVAADAARLAGRADASLLVLVAGSTRRHEAVWAKHFLDETGTPLLGAVLNKVKAGSSGYSYHYYYGYNRYGETRKELRERP